MKKFYVVFIFAFLFLAGSTQAQIYVKADAAGANDGTSWDNAYVYLDDAINNSLPGDQIWVAAGTYKPGGATPDSSSTYSFPHDLEMYGGFTGTETMITERDWELNETILSGDHMGNDIDDVYGVTRSDNSLHVMFLTDTVSTASVIDGFTVRNGNTLDTEADDRRCGGILTYGAPTVRNCYFTQNYGFFGAALYPRGGVDSMVIDNCVFEKNRAGGGGGAVYTFSEGGVISNCTFMNNITLASRAGGIYVRVSQTVSNCIFEGNEAAVSSGGGLQVLNTTDTAIVHINDCTFQGNVGNWGAALGVYNATSNVFVDNCEFIGNESNAQGGAATHAFGATVTYSNTLFRLNEAAATGGALFSQNDQTTINLINCTLSENSATTTGGAINMNGSGNNFLTTDTLPELTIENTLFSNNLAIQQGGAINFSNGNFTATNTIFEYNIITEEGVGGAISFNTVDSLNANPEYKLINCTVVNNEAITGTGAGVATWLIDSSLVTSNLVLQNNIFYNPGGENFLVEAGLPMITSLGGNLSTDATLDTVLVNTNDLVSTLPLFVDFDDDNYNLQDGSPCVDAGILAGAPLFDMLGNPRVDNIDMGAFENQKLVGVQDLKNTFGLLKILPNPVEDNLNFSFESLINGEIFISVTNMEGKVIFTKEVEKSQKEIIRNYNVTQLPKGMYNLTITNGKYTNTESFVKIK